MPMIFGHHVAAESTNTWGPLFTELLRVEGFEVDDRTTIVEQEKSINCTHRTTKAVLFLEFLYVKKTWHPILVRRNHRVCCTIEKAVRTPSTDISAM